MANSPVVSGIDSGAVPAFTLAFDAAERIGSAAQMACDASYDFSKACDMVAEEFREILQGLDVLIAAPDLQGDIELVQPSVFFRYADPAIEALPDSQKLMIRIGPGNREVVRRKAERLRDALTR